MLNSTRLSTHPWQSLFNRLEKPVTALLLTLGLATVGLAQTAQGVEASAVSEVARASVGTTISQTLPDGIYLYGQSPEAEQLGSAYMVFEVTDNRVVGAFYMPQSSFDCFYGEMQPREMALNVIDSYERTVNPYSIATETSDPVASTSGEAATTVSIEGFHPIASVSNNDQRILNTCKADVQNN